MNEPCMESLSLASSECETDVSAGLFTVYLKDLSKGIIGLEFRTEEGQTLRGSLSYCHHSVLMSYKLSYTGTFSVRAGILQLDSEKAGLSGLEVPVASVRDLRSCSGTVVRWR